MQIDDALPPGQPGSRANGKRQRLRIRTQCQRLRQISANQHQRKMRIPGLIVRPSWGRRGGSRMENLVLSPGSIEFQRLSVHPAFWLNFGQPILRGRNAPEIFSYVLLSDVAHGNCLAVAVDDGYAKDAFTKKN